MGSKTKNASKKSTKIETKEKQGSLLPALEGDRHEDGTLKDPEAAEKDAKKNEKASKKSSTPELDKLDKKAQKEIAKAKAEKKAALEKAEKKATAASPKGGKPEPIKTEKKSMRGVLLHTIEKTRANKKSTLGTREKLIAKFQKDFSDREPKVVQDALVRYINDAKKNPLGKYLLVEDESGISITRAKSSKE